MENEIKEAVTYEYKTVRIKRAFEEMLIDAYQTLGYEVTNTQMAEGSLNCVNVSFKRNRKIANKMELMRVQEKIDATLLNIDKLQKQKKNAGVLEGSLVGALGCLTFGGGLSMVMVLSGIGYLIGGIALGVVGVGIGYLGYVAHKKISSKKLAKLEPMFQSELDKLSDLCEVASKIKK